MFTTRHYRAIAEIIRRLPIAEGDRFEVMDAFAKALSNDNPRFNGNLFRIACGEPHERGHSVSA